MESIFKAVIFIFPLQDIPSVHPRIGRQTDVLDNIIRRRRTVFGLPTSRSVRPPVLSFFLSVRISSPSFRPSFHRLFYHFKDRQVYAGWLAEVMEPASRCVDLILLSLPFSPFDLICNLACGFFSSGEIF